MPRTRKDPIGTGELEDAATDVVSEVLSIGGPTLYAQTASHVDHWNKYFTKTRVKGAGDGPALHVYQYCQACGRSQADKETTFGDPRGKATLAAAEATCDGYLRGHMELREADSQHWYQATARCYACPVTWTELGITGDPARPHAVLVKASIYSIDAHVRVDDPNMAEAEVVWGIQVEEDSGGSTKMVADSSATTDTRRLVTTSLEREINDDGKRISTTAMSNSFWMYGDRKYWVLIFLDARANQHHANVSQSWMSANFSEATWHSAES